MEAMDLVHHVQPSAQKNSSQDILEHFEPSVEVRHLAGTSHLVGHLPTGVTGTAAACPG